MSDSYFTGELAGTISEALSLWKCASVGLGVIKGGETVFCGGFGKRDLENGLDADGDTLYQIGSSSKSFTAALCAKLVDEGKLSWDKPIRETAPELRFYDAFTSDNVTLRDLLCHRTGVPRHEYSWYGNQFTRKELAENVRFLEPNQPFRSRMQYNNYGYVLAGYLVEKVTGMTWEKCLEEYLFRPLGMNRTTAFLDDIEQDENHAVPYSSPEDGSIAGTRKIPFYRTEVEDKAAGTGAPFGPAGSINSSPSDMLKWLKFHLGDGSAADKRILSEASLNELHKPNIFLPAPLDMPHDETILHSYAMGWMVEVYRGHKVMHHGGNINGFSAMMFAVPDLDLGIVALTNMDSCFLHMSVVRTIVDHYLGIEGGDWINRYYDFSSKSHDKLPETIHSLSGDKIPGTTPGHLPGDYAGSYARKGYGPCSVSAEDGRLMLHFLGADIPLEHYHYDTFTTAEIVGELPPGIPVCFFTAEDSGKISALSMPLVMEAGGRRIRFEKVSG